jgi:solute carrier family 25 oxoglutarate transporter 11
MLGPFDEVKERLNKYYGLKEDTLKVRMIAAGISGFLAAFCSLPFDNAKTKMQKMVKNSEGVMPYKGVLDCISKSVKNEGLGKLWVGFPTYYFRVAPHVMLTWISIGALNKIIWPAGSK